MVIGGVERKARYFVIDLPHSDGCFVKAYPAETIEAFLDGHVSALAFLGGVPRSILYDNTRRMWRRILSSRELDFTQNPGKVMDDITFVRSHWWLVSEGFSLSTANSDVQKLPATLYHRIADSLAYAA